MAPPPISPRHGFPALVSRLRDGVFFLCRPGRETRPYQQLPFQYSLHRVDAAGELAHEAFLALGRADPGVEDPGEAFAESLVRTLWGGPGPVYVYNAGFERRIMRELAERFPHHAAGLHDICERLVDLLPIARNRYYHPAQCGSWKY